jgi:hypothetical protein
MPDWINSSDKELTKTGHGIPTRIAIEAGVVAAAVLIVANYIS